jgi:hypothetical protein
MRLRREARQGRAIFSSVKLKLVKYHRKLSFSRLSELETGRSIGIFK